MRGQTSRAEFSMFDIGWSELVVIAVVALIAIGPKELPGVLRMVGQWMGKARRLASDFQGQFNEAMREAEMADIKKQFDEVSAVAKGMSPTNLLTSAAEDFEKSAKIDEIPQPVSPEPPTPDTFVEAETHAAVTETPAAVEPASPQAVPDAKAS
jgi:sec-independent protein translocase protein TatB